MEVQGSSGGSEVERDRSPKWACRECAAHKARDEVKGSTGVEWVSNSNIKSKE